MGLFRRTEALSARRYADYLPRPGLLTRRARSTSWESKRGLQTDEVHDKSTKSRISNQKGKKLTFLLHETVQCDTFPWSTTSDLTFPLTPASGVLRGTKRNDPRPSSRRTLSDLKEFPVSSYRKSPGVPPWYGTI